MPEKMLVTQALDERDLLVKKINEKIALIKLVDTKKVNEEKTAGQRVTTEEFSSTATSAYQQIMDYIDRYQRLDAAIVASNATHFVETSRGRFSVAGAIALRARLKGSGIYAEEGAFEKTLQSQFETQMNAAIREADIRNRAVETQADSMRMAIVGRDNKGKTDGNSLDVVNAFIAANRTEIIDPLDAAARQQELKERVVDLLSELDTQIKVSNATTMVEF